MRQALKDEGKVVDVESLALIPISSAGCVVLPPGSTSFIKWSWPVSQARMHSVVLARCSCVRF